jgi:hypothetical protein
MAQAMPPEARRRFDAFASAELTWHPVRGGDVPLVVWRDRLEKDLGPDAGGERFEAIAQRMLGGRYYPPDVLEFFGLWLEEEREIRAGDRMLQRARLVPWLRRPVVWAMTEAFVAERGPDACTIGYVTTRRHFGRGIWQATLTRREGRLTLLVESTAGPGSWLFWLGLPYARFLQLRARRRAVEEFRKL